MKGILKVNFLTNTQHLQDLHVLLWGVFLGSIYDLHATVLSLQVDVTVTCSVGEIYQVDYSDLLD